MSPALFLLWVAFGYALLQGIRYLLGARLYLTCALREVEARPVNRQLLDAAELRLVTLLDDELRSANFRHLGFGQITPLITYYAQPLAVSVYVNEQIPAHALVRRHLAPEYGRLVELEIRTAFVSGNQVLTVNTPFAGSFLPPSLHVEAHPGLSVRELVERHAVRVVAGDAQEATVKRTSLEDAMALIEASMAELRTQFREHGWVVASIDPRLDRFTLRGAFALTHHSRRVLGARQGAARQPLPAPIVNEELLRIEADLHAVEQLAEDPETAPGTPWPLLTVIGGTALLSFVAMAALWNGYVAALILAAVSFHEAGHALAMRMLGYRDVHVFFVPLLGAMTVGRPAATTVRDRLTVLLAGPVPGLWLAVLLLAIYQASAPAGVLRIAALTLLILNGLNLLPFTPLDGGRALEALTRPESLWRSLVHASSAGGLLALAAYLRDPAIAALGLVWTLMLPRQWSGYRLRSAVAARVGDREDFRGVVRAALEVMAAPRYAAWRAPARQATARAIARLFSESIATAGDRKWGAIAYAAAWIPVAVALLLWSR
jgi:Zn-dependent protease